MTRSPHVIKFIMSKSWRSEIIITHHSVIPAKAGILRRLVKTSTKIPAPVSQWAAWSGMTSKND